jgi:hypothetical protein
MGDPLQDKFVVFALSRPHVPAPQRRLSTNRRTVGTVAMRPLKLKRIAIFS